MLVHTPGEEFGWGKIEVLMPQKKVDIRPSSTLRMTNALNWYKFTSKILYFAIWVLGGLGDEALTSLT